MEIPLGQLVTLNFTHHKNGVLKRCGQPILSTSHTKPIGYSKEGFCPHCKEIKDVIVATFTPQNPEAKEVTAICNVCHTPLKDNLEGGFAQSAILVILKSPADLCRE